MGRRALLGWIAMVGLAAAVQGQVEPRVTAIELRSDAPLSLAEDLLDWVTIEVGEHPTGEGVARTLRGLHAAGVASRIEAYREPAPGGVRLIFVLYARTLIEKVEWTGDLGLAVWRVRDATAIGEGDPLVADRVFRSVYQIRELHENEGYLGAVVRVEVEETEARRRATVRFRIDSGEPATVGAVRFTGELGSLTPRELAGALRTQEGGRYRRRVARDDADRLEDWLLARGHRQATVAAPVENVSDDDGIGIVYAVELGPRFEVVATGDAEALKKRHLLPLRGNERYDDATLIETERRVRTAYQERGHHRVDVQVDEEVVDDIHRISVAVDPGPRSELETVRFMGNEALSDARLQAVMQISGRRLLTPRSGRLVDEWLENDLRALRALYALEGFAEAEVGPPEILESSGRLELVIPVEEGDRRLVANLDLVGVLEFDEKELLSHLPLFEGGPYHLRREEEALDLIRARHETAGFDLAQVVSKVETSANGSLVNVLIEVVEGPRSVVERVVVRGRQRTRLEVIRRAVDLEPGTPINRRKLLDLQRRLYGLGVFSRVDVGLVPGTPYSPGRDVRVDVREGKSRRLLYGVGYDSEDGLRGLLGFSHGNLWGRAMSGRIDVRASSRDQQARALLRQPYLGRFRLPMTYSVFRIEEEEESFSSRRIGSQVELERFRGDVRWSLLYTYKRVELEDPDPALELLLVDRRFQDVAVSSLSPSVTIDHRDDAVDPQSGWSATVLTEYAFPLFQADEEFGRLFLQHSRYLTLGRLGVLAASVRGGLLEPLGDAAELDPVCVESGFTSPTCRIKISERYFAGGRSTHRAYRRDRLGIPGETLLEVADEEIPVPFGGTGLLLANLDYRFPIGGGVGGTLFVDAGNLWADWRDISLSGMKLGAGVGVRYASPIGPIRLEAGWKLDRLPNEDPYVVLFSFGNPF